MQAQQQLPQQQPPQQQQIREVQPRPQLMLVSAPGDCLQLPAQAKLSITAQQLSASAAAAHAGGQLLAAPMGLQQQQVPPQQLLQDVSMLGAVAPCGLGYNMLQDWQAAGQQQQLLRGGGGVTANAATADAGWCMPHAAVAAPYAAEAVGGSGTMCGTGRMQLMQLAAPAGLAWEPAAAALDAQMFGQGSGVMLHDCSSINFAAVGAAVQAQAPAAAGGCGTGPMVYNHSVCVAAPAGYATAGNQVAIATWSAGSSGTVGQVLSGANGCNAVTLY
jgi:hypothetical protein